MKFLKELLLENSPYEDDLREIEGLLGRRITPDEEKMISYRWEEGDLMPSDFVKLLSAGDAGAGTDWDEIERLSQGNKYQPNPLKTNI